MKILKYKFLLAEINHGTEEEPDIEPILDDKVIKCSDTTFESNLATAKREAYNGEVTVEEVEGEETEPTTGDRVTVQFDIGSMPLPGTTKSMAHGIENMGRLISLRGTATDGTAFLALPCEGATLYISGEYVCIACSADLSGYTDVTLQIEYEVG